MKFSIKDLRDAVSVLNYIRNDFSGSTREEQLRCNLRERYAQHIADVQELLNMTPIRFERDIENARHAIESALAQILRNETRQAQANAEPAPCEQRNYSFTSAGAHRTLLRGLSLKALRMKTTDWPALTDNERALAALERERMAVYSSDWDSMLQGVTTRDNVPPDMIFKAWFESQFPFLPNEVSNGVE